MHLKGVVNRAKHAFEEHGGTEGLKDDVTRARRAAATPGSIKDKATAVRDAVTHKHVPDGDVDEVAPLAEDRPPAQTGSQAPPDTPPTPPAAAAESEPDAAPPKQP